MNAQIEKSPWDLFIENFKFANKIYILIMVVISLLLKLSLCLCKYCGWQVMPIDNLLFVNLLLLANETPFAKLNFVVRFGSSESTKNKTPSKSNLPKLFKAVAFLDVFTVLLLLAHVEPVFGEALDGNLVDSHSPPPSRSPSASCCTAQSAPPSFCTTSSPTIPIDVFTFAIRQRWR